jgi:DNA-binding SARP family transcriptional activator
LRNALWRLRQGLQSVGVPVDDYLFSSDDSVSFLTTSPYWLDVEVFETIIIRYQDSPGEDLTPTQASELEAAVDLYSGDLLEGIYDDWCLYDRERLSLAHLKALNKLMLYHGPQGAYERALAYGERILALDNTREKVHRQMMQLHWLAGDRNAALAQYKRCVQILRDELGTPPTEETTRLYQQMVNNDYSPLERPSPSSKLLKPKDQALQPLVEHALQKVRRLQTTLEETNAELRHLEHLINMALLNNG